MTTSRANKPDTVADERLRQCLIQAQKRNFVMVAGAGSGKTTSLIKALSSIIACHGKTLALNRRRIACITYTEVAAKEIWADVGNNPLIHVSTIHSFFWSILKSFQRDIHSWVLKRIDERVAELEGEAAAFGPRVRERTREKNRRDIEKFNNSKDRVRLNRTFTYGTGSNYAKGILGHDDIIRLAIEFLNERSLFQILVAQQFPFVFVDESQDTQKDIVDALKAIVARAGSAFCLGFFGDPMQRIYPTGIGEIPTDETWLTIEKEENFRCPTAVLNVANAVRAGGDHLVQVGGRHVDIANVRTPVQGTARIFVLPADEHRNDRLAAVREFIARENADPSWSSGEQAKVKILVIVHRMAATRLGFGSLYEALNDKAPEAFKEGFLDASAWPLRPIDRFVMPLAEAMWRGNEFEAMSILRKNCPLLTRERLRVADVAAVLSHLREASQSLTHMVGIESTASVRDVLELLRQQEIIDLDPRLISYLDNGLPQPNEEEGDEIDEEDNASKEIASMDRFLSCPAKEFIGYREYLAQQSPFSTQQGIKGTEFERVLVILDDDEGTHLQFSYDKFFGVKPLSDRDLENIAQGKETAVERTRRLFYVCCTRALTDLAVVYFSTDPVLAETKVRESGYFVANSVFNEADVA